MLSFGTLSARAARIAARSRGFIAGSGRPIFAATVISRDSLPNTFERTASCRPLRCMMFLNWEWPATTASEIFGAGYRSATSKNLFPKRRACFRQVPAQSYRGDARRETRRVVDLDRNRTEGRLAVGGLELARRDAADKPLQRLGLVHADDGIMVASHADVGDEGSPARQHAVICGL